MNSKCPWWPKVEGNRTTVSYLGEVIVFTMTIFSIWVSTSVQVSHNSFIDTVIVLKANNRSLKKTPSNLHDFYSVGGDSTG